MDNDIGTGASREEVLAWSAELEEYITGSIIEPCITKLGAIFSECLYYCWCSDNAIKFRNHRVHQTQDNIKMVMIDFQALRNTVYSAYNIIAKENDADLIDIVDAGVGSDKYNATIEEKLVELRAKNSANRFGMNKNTVNNLVIPKLREIINEVHTAIEDIPKLNGLYDETGDIEESYNNYVSWIKYHITSAITDTIVEISEKLDTEMVNATLATTNAESTFTA